MRRSLVALFSSALAACGGSGLRFDGPHPTLSAPDGGSAAEPAADAGEGDAREDAGATDATDAGSGPPYPIVLCHGFSGWSSIGPYEYFYGVPEALRADGHDVHVAEVDPFNDSITRGRELLAYVQRVLAETGAAKVDLVAHSQGGLDARYVASELPSAVAAVVTISAPHRGTPIADLAVGAGGGPALQAELATIFGAGGGVDLSAAMLQLTSAGAARFNSEFPDAPGVAYYSIAGRSNLAPDDGVCETAEPPFVAKWDADRDPIGAEFAVTGAILTGNPFSPTYNDGLVPVSSAKWGEFLGCLPADHLDEIGQPAGASPGFGNPFDYKQFYRDLANWLVAQGD